MSLKALVGTKPPSKPRAECVIKRLAATLPKGEGQALLTLMLDLSWPLSRVHEAVQSEFPDVEIPHYSTFQRHRAGKCPCPNKAAP